jgi:iron complex outermembrane receptor protein
MFGGSGPGNKEGTALWRLTGMVRDGGSQVDFVRDNRVFIAPAVTFKPDEDTTLTLLQHGGCFYADARKAVAKLTYRW